MKRNGSIAAALLLAALLSSCADVPKETKIQVCVVETEGISIQDNGVWIQPGGSAGFLLNIQQGYEILDVDYSGEYRLSDENGLARLELLDVHYPTRVAVTLAQTAGDAPALSHYREITYTANGGAGADVTESYNIRLHSRPNTSIGEGFVREGFTLTGWNTTADGSGLSVGLGSRVSVPQEGLTLYAQWASWTDPVCFTWEERGGGLTLTGCAGVEDALVIPEDIDGISVTAIAARAFQDCPAKTVILPKTLEIVEPGAFDGCALRELTLFDSIDTISDGSFSHCPAFRTLRINAAEDPYGYSYRRESVYADKADLLISAQGTKKMVFYGGCSMWYNLNGSEADRVFGEGYTVINMGLNGTVNSLVQMEILGAFMEEGDILFHTPELSSRQQLLLDVDMSEGDDKLWCGLEYNYDLFALVDLRGLEGVLDSLCAYLAKKQPGGSYYDVYRDSGNQSYLDYTGSIPFLRAETLSHLDDTVSLDPAVLADGLPLLREVYQGYMDQGVKVYVSYACVDLDALSPEQRGNVAEMDLLFKAAVDQADGPTVISRLAEYLYNTQDFYDTHYHLLSQAAYQNTGKWLRDLKTQMTKDGLWSGEGGAP